MDSGTAPAPARRRPAVRLRAGVLAAAFLPLGLAGCTAATARQAEAPPPSLAGKAVPPVGATPVLPSPNAGPSPGPSPGGPLSGRTVALDPGHNPGNFRHSTEIGRQVDVGNGHKECDTTGTETDAGYTEADYTLDVVHRVRDILRARGAQIVLTHDGDSPPWGPCVDERAAVGNAAHADAAISVHADGGPATGSGFHVIMPARVVAGKADTSAIVAPSHRLGLLVRDRYAAATGEPYADYVADQGLDTRSDLGGLNLSTVPKVFIECANMRNATDASRVTDPTWRQKAAQGIADALTAFLTTS